MMIMHENLVFLKHDDEIFYATVCFIRSLY